MLDDAKATLAQAAAEAAAGERHQQLLASSLQAIDLGSLPPPQPQPPQTPQTPQTPLSGEASSSSSSSSKASSSWALPLPFPPSVSSFSSSGRGAAQHVIIGGDFNTHNHGIARFSRKMSGMDGLLGLGKTEAQWWHDEIFADSGLRDPFGKSDDSHNTWISVAGIPVWGGKIDWLLYSEGTLACSSHHISEGGKSSDHPYLRLDLERSLEL